MGITSETFDFFLHCKNDGVSFERICQIGRQKTFFDSQEYMSKYDDFSEQLFFDFLGAKSIDSLDYSDYEGATIIHDMNLPVNKDMEERFSAVLDGGTLEHVFNYPVAIKNCMRMVEVGAHLILVTPANNFFGHGFYQFSPELFFSVLGEQNGFTQTQIFVQDDSFQWYKIKNPQDIKKRVDICCAERKECLIYVVSKKINSTPQSLTVLQSDYVLVWGKEEFPEIPGTVGGTSRRSILKTVKRLLRQILARGAGCRILQDKEKIPKPWENLYEKVNLKIKKS